MLYIIETLGFMAFFYYLTKKYFLTIKEAIGCAIITFIIAFFVDLLLYQQGFTFIVFNLFILSTAHNLFTSLICNGIPLIGALIGVGISAKKN